MILDSNTQVLVTGGAGFIGSHVVDALVDDATVVAVDDLSTGSLKNLAHIVDHENFQFIEGSILDSEILNKCLDDVDVILHFAANPDARPGIEKPEWEFRLNVVGSFQILNEMRKRDISRIFFASSGGAAYGDPLNLPTGENTPLRPISNYGASKAAIEMYLSSFSNLYGIDTVSLRLGNIIGPRLTHGVVFDFYNKIKANPRTLEVLGDGSQEKSYMYISDTVGAIEHLLYISLEGFTPINIASRQRLSVKEIAQIVIDEMGTDTTRIKYAETRRGWKGDVPITDLDISHLQSLGWDNNVDISTGIRRHVRWLIDEFGAL